MNTQQGPLGPAIAIVLGAGVESDGRASERTRARTEAAARLAHADPTLTIIVTGDGHLQHDRKFKSRTEASAMAKILMELGISRDRIRLEHQSCDTMGNAVFSAARYLFKQTPRHTYVVTSPFHAERALVMFRGVLGQDWPVEAYLSDVCSGDAEKAGNESGGIDWARRFMAGTTPGDIVAMVNLLRTKGKPRYRKVKFLSDFLRDASQDRAVQTLIQGLTGIDIHNTPGFASPSTLELEQL